MANAAPAALFAVLASALALFSGCVGDAGPQQPSQPPSSAAQFLLPFAPVAYTAGYQVSDGEDSFTKTVWRKGTSARVDLEIAPGSSFSMFFVQGRGYSCSRVTGAPLCYEILSGAQAEGLGGIFESPDYSEGKEIDPVEIGGSTGRCFLFPYSGTAKRKMCFTDRNVVAYDEYNATARSTHVEYLESIAYSADDSAFALPAAPQSPPS